VGCKLPLMEDLNTNVGFPCNKREEVIVDLIDELYLIDSFHGFWLWTPCRTATRAKRTWHQQRGTTWHYLQPDYILAQAGGTHKFKGVGFHFPRFLHSNHCAVVAVVRAGGEGRLKTYRRKHQNSCCPCRLVQKTRTRQLLTHLQLSALTQSRCRSQGKIG
jgi:hypothetical protein